MIVLELAGRLEIIVPSRRRGGVHRLVQVRVARLEHTLIGRGGAIRGQPVGQLVLVLQQLLLLMLELLLLLLFC
jgi:hypothetical protein